MTVTVTKLCTQDMLIFDNKNYESYIVKPDRACKNDHELLAMAKELVASGHGAHLTRSNLNQIHHATIGIILLS